MLNRPLAVRAAWQIALNLQPANEVVKNSLQKYFETQSPYPRLARKAWSFRSMAPDADPRRAQAWEKALGAAATGKLTDALQAFEQLTAEAPADADAWFNLGLCRAWLGDNAAALEAFDQCVSAETDDDRAAEAWALAEILRFGHGMEESCDWAEWMVRYQIVDFQKLGTTLKNDRRFTDLRQMENGAVGGVLLDRPMPAAHANLALFELPKVLAYLAVANDTLLLQNGNSERLQQARQLVESTLGGAVEFREEAVRAPEFVRTFQMLLDLRLPSGVADDVAAKLMREAVVQYLEDNWPHRHLRSLGMITPLDAVGHAVLRRKVIGLVNFIDDLTHSYVPLPYNVDRLRHKLGLPMGGAESPGEVSGQPADIRAMNAAELASLNIDELSDADLELAMQTGRRLDAPELAGKFARALIARPNNAQAPDRFAAFNHLIQLALAADQPEEALGLVEAGMKHDCEHNEGRRRNDYDLRGAQIHLKAGQPEQAHLAFSRLVERLPSDFDLLGKASEGMLRANRRAEAAEFAEKGVAAARAKGDKDRLGYFEELLAAAKR
jgi:tetratricopeptide (TPR) repeat protein